MWSQFPAGVTPAQALHVMPQNWDCCYSLFLILHCHPFPTTYACSPGWQMHRWSGIVMHIWPLHTMAHTHRHGHFKPRRLRAWPATCNVIFHLEFRHRAGTSSNLVWHVSVLFLNVNERKQQQLWAKPTVKHDRLSSLESSLQLC